MTLYLSRLKLARRPQTEALRRLIDPDDPGQRLDANHRLLWSLFADGPDRRRDFLWRAEGEGRFLTLSARPPDAAGAGLFDPPEVKDFAPDLRPGDKLSFLLRVNATRTRVTSGLTASGRERVAHHDVVMDDLRHLPPGTTSDARREARLDIAQRRGAEWLAGQGERHGFRAREVIVADYSVVGLPGHRGPRKGQPQFGILDMTGVIEVAEPTTLLAQIVRGFGRAKAFGCGLMLIRRA